MIERDTIKLLRECDAGVKMGVSSIDEVIGSVKGKAMKEKLYQCREEHEKLGRELQGHLDRFGDRGKDPNPVAKGMSWLKTETMLGLERSDKVIADLGRRSHEGYGQAPDPPGGDAEHRSAGVFVSRKFF